MRTLLDIPDSFTFRFTSAEFDGFARDPGPRGMGDVRPEVTRTLTIDDAIQQNQDARTYLGVHWKFDSVQGAVIGKEVRRKLWFDAPPDELVGLFAWQCRPSACVNARWRMLLACRTPTSAIQPCRSHRMQTEYGCESRCRVKLGAQYFARADRRDGRKPVPQESVGLPILVACDRCAASWLEPGGCALSRQYLSSMLSRL